MPGTTLNITDLVTYKGVGYRVTHFKKRVEDNFPNNPYDLVQRPPLELDDEINQIIIDIAEMERLKEKFSRAEKGLPHTRRYRFQHCVQSEATHVALYGLTYPIAPVEDVIYEGPISWSPELIKQEQESASSDFYLIHRPFSDWYWE